MMSTSVEEQWGLIDYRRLAHVQFHSHSVEINMEFLFCYLQTGVSARWSWSSTGVFIWTTVLDCSKSHEGELIELV